MSPGPWALASAYVAITLAVTWPLATMPATALAADFGDAAFIASVMAWVADHLTAILRGDMAAWDAMWHAPIFAPEPDTLTYSEHHIGQTLQVLPFYWAANQPLLAFNVIYVLTFALTGLAAHRLAHAWTGSHLAGAVAGLTCAFNDYRLYWSMSHLHALSIHWWLFALWGIDRFVAGRSSWALGATTLALVMLHLSSSYLMAFCAPFTAGFAVWSLARHGRLRDGRAWVSLGAAGAISVAVVWPLVQRYLATLDRLDVVRSPAEILGGSVSLVFIRLAAPWLAPLVALAILGVLAPAWSSPVLSRRARWALLGLALAAVVLSMGPVMQFDEFTLPGPYRLLVEFVPGFSGLRVPYRFIAIALGLFSILGGIGAAWLARWRLGVVAILVLTALAVRPVMDRFTINRMIPSVMGLALPPDYLRPSAEVPAIYSLLATTAPDAVIIELPFGDTAYEIRYTFFTRAHGRRIANGYSGVQPPSYLARLPALGNPLAGPEAAWSALPPATHVIVHTVAWADDTGTRLRAWLESRGATAMGERNGAWLYALPSR